MKDPYVPTAFPVEIVRDQYGNIYAPGSQGMSLRDWFAGMALNGSLSSPELLQVLTTGPIGSHFDRIAKNSYQIADAMLAARGTK